MIKTWEITLPRLSGDVKRRAYVYLPFSYKSNPHKRYPVLYMFDGHNLFFDDHATYGKSWGLKEFMDQSKTQMIIAAIECSHDPDNGRLKEYSPYSFEDHMFGKVEGRGEETMQWLIKVFKRQVDRKFRTLPDRDHTFIAGSSMGGLMSYYAVLEHNDVFSRAACLSPSLWTEPKKLMKLAKQADIDPNTHIYMDYGSEELGNHDDMLRGFTDFTAALMMRRIFVESRIVPYGQHCEACWENQIPIFMKTLTYGLEDEMKVPTPRKGNSFWLDWTNR